MNALKSKKSPQKKTAPVKEVKEGFMESGEESDVEDNTQASINEEDEEGGEQFDSIQGILGKHNLLSIQSPKHTNFHDLRNRFG